MWGLPSAILSELFGMPSTVYEGLQKFVVSKKTFTVSVAIPS